MKTPAILEFDLEPNSQVDAVIAASALIDWVEAIREASKVIDPSSEMAIDLVSAEPACLRFTAALDFIDNKMTDASKALDRWPQIKKIIALNVLILPGAVAGGVTVALLTNDDGEDVEDAPVAQEVEQRVANSSKVQERVKSFYNTIQREPAIRQVIVRERGDGDAIITVDRKEFAERSGLWAIEADQESDERENGDIWEVVVTHPVSIGKPLKWGFMHKGLPFRAKMMDEEVLAGIRSGNSAIPVEEGVTLQVRVSWTEKSEGALWVPDKNSYQIEQVLR